VEIPQSASDPKTKSKVLLVDDHPIVRQGLLQLINAAPDLIVCGEASTGREALELLETVTPDIVIVDISLEDRNGLELIKDITARNSQLPCLVLSMYDESMYALRVLRAGGRGYIMKQERPKVVVNAIRQVLAGHVYLSEPFSSRLLDEFVARSATSPPVPNGLTDRELEVLTLLGRGYGTREIAEKLLLSIKTVEAHRERIKKKMGLKNGVELMRFAILSTVGLDLPKRQQIEIQK
jgi:DNA-binding NarL/FixJ family response regulator